jgi:hypothetical protein
MKMGGREIELTAYCGLYCGDCIRYKNRVSDLACELIGELQKARFEKYAEVKSLFVKELKHYKQCCQVLESLVELQCRSGCRNGGCPTFSCRIIECCGSHGFRGCWECDRFDGCEAFRFLEPFHGDIPLKNLRKIRELGLDKWVRHREKFYLWL